MALRVATRSVILSAAKNLNFFGQFSLHGQILRPGESGLRMTTTGFFNSRAVFVYALYNLYDITDMDNVRLWKPILVGLVVAGAFYGLLHGLRSVFPPRPNLLLITIDTLRADHLGCYDYPRPTSPNIDALASRGILFERFISPRGLTVPALATLLTGLECHHHRVRYNFQLPKDSMNLAHILAEKGYQCRAYLSNVDGLVRVGFDESSQGFSEFANHAKRDRLTTDRGREFLVEQARQPSRPFFLWLHYMSPHRPFKPPEPWERGLDGQSPRSSTYYDNRLEEYMAEKADLSDGTLETILNYYDGCVALVDSLVADVLATLEEQSLEENTLVVFTADHGEELYEHLDYFLHQLSMYDGTLRIPLILSWKGKLPEGIRVPEQVGLVHLMPTLLELLDVGLEHPIDGESFWDLAQSYTRGALPADTGAIRRSWQQRPILIEMIREEGCAYGVYRYPHKSIVLEETVGFHTQPASGSNRPITTHSYPPAQLFDLLSDPEERRNLAGQKPEVQAELQQIVQERLLKFVNCLEDRSPQVSDLESDQLEALRALGYVVPGQSRKSLLNRGNRPDR